MDTRQDIFMLQALNEAIWIRDNAQKIDKQSLFDAIASIGEHNIYSSRQIASFTNGALDHSSVSKIIKKKNKTGGNLNVHSLEELREVFYSRERKRTNYKLIAKIIQDGTSQGMVEKLTGVKQSTISRKIKEIDA